VENLSYEMNRRTMLHQSAAAAACLSLAELSADDVRAAEPANVARAKRGMVATVNPLATDAGVSAFQRGGNAIDAAIAAAITLGVVDQHNSGLGGGCFILLRTADGPPWCIDGRETAPAKAARDMYVVDGKPQPSLSQTGPLAVATPGALAAYNEALHFHGKLKLSGGNRRSRFSSRPRLCRQYPHDQRLAGKVRGQSKIAARGRRLAAGGRNRRQAT
jgi:gamma-glutamyltranspeptidase/glutathione hydrolase